MFDSLGRIASRYEVTPSGAHVGWTVTYASGGGLSQVWYGDTTETDHTRRHVLTFATSGAGLASVSLTPPGGSATTYANFIRSGTMVMPDTHTYSYSGTLTELQLPVDGRTREFQYRVLAYAWDSANGHQSWFRLDYPRMTSVAINGTEVASFGYPSWPASTCAVGSTIQSRVRSVSDRTGTWEIRRRGSSVADTNVCSGTSSVDDQTSLHNPCSSGEIAVLDVNNAALDSSGNRIACSAADTYSGTSCANGTLCSTSTSECVHYSCYSIRSTTGAEDQPTAISDNGCGCSNASEVQWETIGTGRPIERVTARRDTAGRWTWYDNDTQGRLIASCEGTTSSTNTLDSSDPSTCPSGAQFTRYTYGDTHWPWAISQIERGTVIGSSGLASTTYLRDTSTGAVTGVLESGYTLTSFTGSGIGTVSQQTRCTAYGYDSSTGLLTTIEGPRAPDSGGGCAAGNGTSSDPIRTFTPYALSTSSTSGQYHTIAVRSERPDHDSGTSRSITTTFDSFDRLGRPTAIEDTDGQTTSFAYDTHDRLHTITNALSEVTTFDYETSGLYRLHSITRPSGQATLNSYGTDPYGHPEDQPFRRTRADDPGATSLSGDYVEDTTFRIALGSTYREEGRTYSGTSYYSYYETQRRDERQRLRWIFNFYLNSYTTFTYDSTTGQLSDVSNGLGIHTAYEYDSAGRVEHVRRDRYSTDAQYTYGYAAQSTRPSSVTYPNGHTINYAYDDFGQLVSSSSGDIGSQRTRFDERGTMIDRSEPDGTRTAFTYDRALRTIAIDYDADRTVFAGDIAYYWDVLHNGDSCPTTSACGHSEGRLAEVITGLFDGIDQTSFYGYDAAGRTLYDAVALGGGTFETTYTYDSAGRLTAMTYPIGLGDEARYQYDLNTGWDAQNFPADAEQIVGIDSYRGGSLHYHLVTRIEHNADGSVGNIWFNENNDTQPTFASVTRGQNYDHSPYYVYWRSGANTSANLGTYFYGHWNDGSIEEINTGSSSTSNYYQYDRLGHLTCASGSFSSSACSTSTSDLIDFYSYDASGNRLTSYSPATGSGAHSLSYPSGSNRRSDWTRSDWDSTHHVTASWGSDSLVGGGPGALIEEHRDSDTASAEITRSMSYLPSGPVSQMLVTDGRVSTNPVEVDSGYDHRGRRVVGLYFDENGNEVVRLFFYDLRDHLIGVYEIGSVARQEVYFWNESEPLFRYVTDFTTELERTFFYNDHLGTPRVAVAVSTSMDSPSVIYRAPRGPFMEGDPVTSPGTGYQPVRMRFPGQWADDGTAMWASASTVIDSEFSDLAHNRAREYDPASGSYSAIEPILIAPRLEPLFSPPFYSYANNEPTRFVDPTGESFRDPACHGCVLLQLHEMGETGSQCIDAVTGCIAGSEIDCIQAAYWCSTAVIEALQRIRANCPACWSPRCDQ